MLYITNIFSKILRLTLYLMYNICVIDYIIDGLYVNDQRQFKKAISSDNTSPWAASQDYPCSVLNE
jgi:hypothetical protein